MTIFETFRLLVRTQAITDAEHYFRIHGDPEVVKYIRAAKTKEQCFEFLQQHIELNKTLFPLGRFLVDEKATSEFVGSFVIIPIENTDQFQLGYALTKQHWGKGYATELVKAGLQYISSNTPLNKIYAITESANASSQHVLLKCGFIFEEEYLDHETLLKKFVFEIINF
ncbi:MAG: GNAT family N-acetyltransferase [Chitinophagaceae bacterium]|nr:GNAT family N-acetyltransferase [Chitinophagaceae bacterium]